MDCPTCSATLEGAEHEGIKVDRCPGGCGEFLESGELYAIAGSEQEPRSEAERAAELAAAASSSDGDILAVIMAEGPRACPACGSKMEKVEYAFSSAIVIDRCAGHGVWLDADELARVEAYAEADRARAGSGAGGFAATASAVARGIAALPS